VAKCPGFLRGATFGSTLDFGIQRFWIDASLELNCVQRNVKDDLQLQFLDNYIWQLASIVGKNIEQKQAPRKKNCKKQS
jgi:hypothetical protein